MIITFSYLIISMLLIFPLVGKSESYFRDVTAEVGIDFQYINGFSPERHFVETLGGGGVLFDYDNDGDLDLYLVQGNYLPKGDPNITNRLYRNDGGRFEEVTAEARVGDSGYGIGAVAADYDDDGYLDIYVTNFGENVLYRNNGDGSFIEVTDQTGVECPLLSTSAAFGDFDKDGDLDLYVCNYAEYSYENEKPCYLGMLRAYCGPQDFNGISGSFYRNNGDDTFTEVTKESGVYEPSSHGFAAVFTDVNDDGWFDIYLASDKTPNLLFINQQNGSFREEGGFRGAAYDMEGNANGSMGIDSADYDNDGDFDLWVTNFALEANCLMKNDGKGYFYDATYEVGLAEPSFYMVGWGTKFVDYDNDGWLDVFVGNGNIYDNADQVDPTYIPHIYPTYGLDQQSKLYAQVAQTYARLDELYTHQPSEHSQRAQLYAQPAQLFKNQFGKFMEVTSEAGLSEKTYVARGLIFGDIDNDGDTDAVLCQSNNRPAVILHNEIGNQKEWLMLRFVAQNSNRDAIGAKVRLVANGIIQRREILCGASYLSGNDFRLLFGLGDAKSVERLEIQWPDGSTQTLENLPTRQILVIRQK